MSARTNDSPEYVHRVMAAIDESETAQNAFISYMETLHHPKDTIIFAHCTEPPYIGTGLGVAGYGFVSGELYEQMLKQRRDDVARLRDRYVNLLRLRGRHIDYRFHAVEFGGNPGEGLVKVAHDVQADMIVMGSRGQGSVRRTVLGSVSDYVIHHAHCPVMVWHNPNQHHHHHHHLHLQDQTAYKKLEN